MEVGTRAAIVREGQRILCMVAFDNEDGTVDVVMDDGTDMDSVSTQDLLELTAKEEQGGCVDDMLAYTGVLVSTNETKPADAMRFVCISDTHGLHRNVSVPPGDVLVHAGDFTNTGEQEQVEDFHDWMASQPHALKIVIAVSEQCADHHKLHESNACFLPVSSPDLI